MKRKGVCTYIHTYMSFNRPTKTANNTLGGVNKYYIGRVIIWPVLSYCSKLVEVLD